MDIEDRVKAEEQVEAFIKILSTRYGIRENEIPEIIDTARWAVRHRAGLSRITWHASLGVVGLAVMGLMAVLWEGVKAVFSVHPPGP